MTKPKYKVGDKAIGAIREHFDNGKEGESITLFGYITSVGIERMDGGKKYMYTI